MNLWRDGIDLSFFPQFMCLNLISYVWYEIYALEYSSVGRCQVYIDLDTEDFSPENAPELGYKGLVRFQFQNTTSYFLSILSVLVFSSYQFQDKVAEWLAVAPVVNFLSFLGLIFILFVDNFSDL